MNARRFIYVLTVRGTLPFPIDMLRYDRCTPNTESDSNHIRRTMDPMNGVTELQVQTDGRDRNWHPTVGRWESFGWKVIEIQSRVQQ